MRALAASPDRSIPVRPPDIETVWRPSEAYWCVAPPVSEVMAPSPQSTVYDPEPGMVTDSPDCVVRHTVTNDANRRGASLDSETPLPAASNTAFCPMSSCGETMASIAARWDGANVTFSTDPDTVTLSPAPGVTPPEDRPDSRTCILDLCTVELRLSLNVADSVPAPASYAAPRRYGSIVSTTATRRFDIAAIAVP